MFWTLRHGFTNQYSDKTIAKSIANSLLLNSITFVKVVLFQQKFVNAFLMGLDK
jgi:hypothetical protein